MISVYQVFTGQEKSVYHPQTDGLVKSLEILKRMLRRVVDEVRRSLLLPYYPRTGGLSELLHATAR